MRGGAGVKKIAARAATDQSPHAATNGPHDAENTHHFCSLSPTAIHTAMAKLGTVLASSGDIFMLTICLLLIEIRRWLDE